MPTTGGRLLDIELLTTVYNLAAEELTGTEIAKIVGVPRNKIYKWLNDPDSYSPFVDEVAIVRALDGEREVYENLTRHERSVFFERSAEILHLQHLFMGDAEITWSVNLARDLGLKRKTLATHHERARARMRANA